MLCSWGERIHTEDRAVIKFLWRRWQLVFNLSKEWVIMGILSYSVMQKLAFARLRDKAWTTSRTSFIVLILMVHFLFVTSMLLSQDVPQDCFCWNGDQLQGFIYEFNQPSKQRSYWKHLDISANTRYKLGSRDWPNLPNHHRGPILKFTLAISAPISLPEINRVINCVLENGVQEHLGVVS